MIIKTGLYIVKAVKLPTRSLVEMGSKKCAAAMGLRRGGLVVVTDLPNEVYGQQVALIVIEVGGQLPTHLPRWPIQHPTQVSPAPAWSSAGGCGWCPHRAAAAFVRRNPPVSPHHFRQYHITLSWRIQQPIGRRRKPPALCAPGCREYSALLPAGIRPSRWPRPGCFAVRKAPGLLVDQPNASGGSFLWSWYCRP